MAWIDDTAIDSRADSRRSHWVWLPRPTGSPLARTTKRPPRVSPLRFASSIRATIRAPRTSSRQRTGDASARMQAASTSSTSAMMPPSPAPPSATSAMAMTSLPTAMPQADNKARATVDRATRMAVSRADARSSTSRTSSRSYLIMPARSAWPGRGTVFLATVGMSAWTGHTDNASAQRAASAFLSSIAMGAPVVVPKRTPPTISRSSCSSSWRGLRP